MLAMLAMLVEGMTQVDNVVTLDCGLKYLPLVQQTPTAILATDQYIDFQDSRYLESVLLCSQ